MKLDTTKVYYLGDLSREQRITIFCLCKFNRYDIFVNADYIRFTENNWRHGKLSSNISNIKTTDINALTLFTKPKDERIAQIQLRIQELNNELIDLDEEMRTLTYEKEI